MPRLPPTQRVRGSLSRRALLAGAGGAMLAGWAPRLVCADEVAEGIAVLRTLFSAVRPMPRASTEAQDLLKPALKLYNAMLTRSVKEWEENGWPTVWTPMHDLAGAWTDILTLAVYHKARGREKYAGYDSRVGYNWVKIRLPMSPRWSITYPKSNDDQLSATLLQNHLGKDPARTIKAWYYRWDTTYSGIGGENAQKLAEVALEADKAVMVTGKREVSNKVEIERLNAAFPRTYTYTVRGEDDEFKAEVRRKNWYLKGKSFTVNIEVIERLAAGLDEDAVTAWHRVGPCPEVESLLASMAPYEKP